MPPVRTESRFIDNKYGKYWLNMSWDHDQTVMHMQPIFETATVAPPPPTPAPAPIKLALSLASGLVLLLFILVFLLLLCCCWRPCPLAEWRHKRKKKELPDKAAEAPLFTGVTVGKTDQNGTANGTANGAVAKAPLAVKDVSVESVDKLESARPTNSLLPPHRLSVSSAPLSLSSAPVSSTANAFSEFANLPSGRRPSGVTTLTNTRSFLSRRDTNWNLQREMIGSLADALVECCTISADSRLLVTVCQNSPPCIWDLLSGVLLRQMEGTEGEASEIFLGSNDSVVIGLFASSPLTAPCLKTWDFESCNQLNTDLPVKASSLCLLHSQPCALLCEIEPDSTRLPSLVFWDLLANDEVRRIHFQRPQGMYPQAGFSYLKISEDDRYVLAGFANNLEPQSFYVVFDLLTSPDVTVKPHVIPFNCRLDCSVILKNGTEACTGTNGGRLVVWSLESGQPLRQLLSGTEVLAPHSSGVAHLVLSANRSLLVSGDSTGVVKFWRTSNELNTAAINVPELTCLEISRDGYLTATGSSNGRISLWRAHGTQPVAELVTNTDITSLYLAPDLSSLVALNSNRRALILRLQRSTLSSHAGSVALV